MLSPTTCMRLDDVPYPYLSKSMQTFSPNRAIALSYLGFTVMLLNPDSGIRSLRTVNRGCWSLATNRVIQLRTFTVSFFAPMNGINLLGQESSGELPSSSCILLYRRVENGKVRWKECVFDLAGWNYLFPWTWLRWVFLVGFIDL